MGPGTPLAGRALHRAGCARARCRTWSGEPWPQPSEPPVGPWRAASHPRRGSGDRTRFPLSWVTGPGSFGSVCSGAQPWARPPRVTSGRRGGLVPRPGRGAGVGLGFPVPFSCSESCSPLGGCREWGAQSRLCTGATLGCFGAVELSYGAEQRAEEAPSLPHPRPGSLPLEPQQPPGWLWGELWPPTSGEQHRCLPRETQPRGAAVPHLQAGRRTWDPCTPGCCGDCRGQPQGCCGQATKEMPGAAQRGAVHSTARLNLCHGEPFHAGVFSHGMLGEESSCILPCLCRRRGPSVGRDLWLGKQGSALAALGRGLICCHHPGNLLNAQPL
ncbi:uncharacterized protein LOC118178813 [Oxyura jamaicensis]|uniref:uncharacterized protein LOC118178813 n=1 Tax=Oxyura jamaicensis TaxID=8884 RepID=UPI0015A6324B|nr:uncharacterized protein LOC118178813 [Oxyura jamaicensis]